MTGTTDRSVSIGRIFRRAFGMIGDNPTVVLGAALLLTALPRLAFSYFVNVLRLSPVLTVGKAIGLGLSGFVAGLIFQSLAIGCITRATVAYSQGRWASPGECLEIAFRRVIPIVVVSILFSLAVLLGFMLLLLPGIFIAVAWAVIVPVTVEEPVSISQAFERADELTRGARWTIFGLALLVILIAMGIGFVVGFLGLLILGFSYRDPAAASSVGPMLLSLVVSTIEAAFLAALQTALYVELREAKEGPGMNRLGQIFE